MRRVLGILMVITAAMVTVSAQARHDRAGYSDAKGATLKVDVPATTPEAFYPSTAFSYSGEGFKPGVVQVGPRTTYLKEGLTTAEVVKLLGQPMAISERTENDVTVTIYEFTRSEDRILIAEFVKGALVRSTMETRRQVARADR